MQPNIAFTKQPPNSFSGRGNVVISLKGVLLAGVVVVSGGCYHATIETGAAPSAQVVEESFAKGWIYGLVPPSTVETASRCPNGVARVETQLSFVNQLVGLFTFGIFTPMSIKVTCAAGGSDRDAADDSEVISTDGTVAGQLGRAIETAAYRSAIMGKPVLVRF